MLGLLGSEKNYGSLRGPEAAGQGPSWFWQGVCCSQFPTLLTLSPDRPLDGLPPDPHLADGEVEAEGGTVTGAGSHSKRSGRIHEPHCQHLGQHQGGCGQQAAARVTIRVLQSVATTLGKGP